MSLIGENQGVSMAEFHSGDPREDFSAFSSF